MPRRSLFGKLWTHGAEVDHVFPGLAAVIKNRYPVVEGMKKEEARSAVVDKIESIKFFTTARPSNIYPRSVEDVRAREVARAWDQNWHGNMGIELVDSPQIIDATSPNVPPFPLAGRELRAVIVGSWMMNGREFKDSALSVIPTANYKDRNAVSFVLGLYKSASASVFRALFSMKRSVKEIDERIAEDLIGEERAFGEDKAISDRTRTAFLKEIRSEMWTMLGSRESAVNLWRLMDSSDDKLRQSATAGWARDAIHLIERRVKGGRSKAGKAAAWGSMHDILAPALRSKGAAADQLAGLLSRDSTSTFISSSLASIKGSNRDAYCGIFDVLKLSESAVIRGSAGRALREDCEL